MKNLLIEICTSDLLETKFDNIVLRAINHPITGGFLGQSERHKTVSNDRKNSRRDMTLSKNVFHSSHSSMYIRKGTDLSCLDMNKRKYCGSPIKEIKRLRHAGRSLVSFSNKDQMKCMNVTVAKHNKLHMHTLGVKVKCRYDYNNLLIYFYLSPIPQVFLEGLQSAQAELQCVPP